MITNAQNVEILSGARKAAILLILIGENASAELIKQLSDDEVQLVGREIGRIRTITSEQAESILDEFYQMVVAKDFVVKGGIDYAKKILNSAFGPEVAKKMLDRLVKSLGNDVMNLDILQKADPQQLAKFVHSEHPQTIALVLSHLNPSQAAASLASLPPGMRADVALRMASSIGRPKLFPKSPTSLARNSPRLGEFSRQSYGGVRAVAEMFLNRLDSVASKEILEVIEEKNAPLVETIRHLMFVFEDLLLIDQTVSEILSRVDRKVLTIALKGTSDQLRAHFLEGMSQRGSEMLKEDMESLGPIKVRDVETAQQQIITLVRQLEGEGIINLKGSVGEQYVV